MAFPPSRGLVSPCLSLSPLVSHCLPTIYVCVGWRVRLPKVLSLLVVFHCLPPPFLFPFLGWCARLFEVLSPWSPRVPHCCPFSPIVSPHVCLWRSCLPFSPIEPIVSHCLPTLVPVLDGASFRRLVFPFCLPLSPHMCACLGWCLSLGVSAFPRSCLLLSACVGWCVRLPEVLFPLLSHLPSCFPLLDGVSAFSTSCLPFSPIEPIVSHCLPTLVPVLDGASFRRLVFPFCLPLSPHMCACLGWCLSLGVSAFPRSCLLLSACVGWCVRLPEVLFPLLSHLPSCFPLLDGVSAFSTSCLPLSPIVSSHVCLCWTVCPTSQGLVSPCLPLFPHMCACNVLCWMVRPPSRGFVSPLVSHCLPSCFPVFDGVSAFPRFCLPCLPACLSAGLPSCLPACLSSCFPLWWVVGFCIFFKQCTVRGS